MYRVLKFGGSSVASATNISRVLDIVEKEAAKGKVVLVSSAISGCTDALLSGDETQFQEMERRHRDIIKRLFTGEDRDTLQQRLDALFQEMRQSPVEEQVTFGEIFSTTILSAKLVTEGYKTVWLDSRELVIKDNEPLTYRNIRESLQATEADIFVAPGFICRNAAGKVDTLGRGGSDYSAAIYAAAVNADSLQIWTDVPGIMTANPKQVPAARTIPRMSYEAALDMASHGAKVLYAPTVAPAMAAGIDIEIHNTFAFPDASRWIGVASDGPVIRLVGANMPGMDGQDAAETAARALREVGIAARKMTADGPSLAIEVKVAVLDQALRTLHRTFFQEMPVKEVNLFVAGHGAVARALLQMVHESAQAVLERTGKQLRIVGLANSRQYGIDLGGEPVINRKGDYIQAVLEEAPKGSIFVDATDSETLYLRYPELLEAGVGIVSSNRRSFAGSYADFAAIHLSARENGVPLRYETTVGAALPILESIARGANSCDEVLSIEAIVSCTLNQILSGGRDALRKLLILSREAGIPLEESEVEVQPIVPANLLQGSLASFYDGLEAYESEWARQALEAEQQGFRRRFVASLEKTGNGYRAGIGLKKVPPVHPAYYLRGTENAIIVRSAFHPYPLVIQGPGEGAREAASSILNDILR